MAGDVHLTMHMSEDSWRSRLHHLAHPEDGLSEHLSPIMDDAFADTQAMVHVITGSLKASGKVDSSYDQHEWHGTISYGGPAAGAINDPVKYAWYEQRRGGAHDFMANVHHHLDAIGAGIIDWMVS